MSVCARPCVCENERAAYRKPLGETDKRCGIAGDFADGLLKAQKVAVVPGTAIGEFGQYNVRLSYATSMSALDEAFSRMQAYLAKL